MTWQPQVNDTIRVFYRGRLIAATVIGCLNSELNTQQQVTSWKVRLASGRIRYICKSNHLKIEKVIEN